MALVATLALATDARAQDDWTLTGFTGIMTDNNWHDAIRFWSADYIRSGLVGVGFGKEFAQKGRFTFGFEIQAVQHFGKQDNFEINTPVIVRYNREGHYLPNLESLAFGLGISWASEEPLAEVERDGDATPTLFYWMIELAYGLTHTENELLFRIHHRSYGFGTFAVDSGSNALTIGLRHRY